MCLHCGAQCLNNLKKNNASRKNKKLQYYSCIAIAAQANAFKGFGYSF